ncbi:MAG: universal stress protein [Phaeodactylibacter sp.]|nr:universal stress protein [Phaeodactylibacter sp.]MCB9050733.1 universal stress protein [Lewinellaceae bacterium]
MKKILVPTDFSNTSRNALFYAMKLADALKAESIDVVHVFLPETAGEADFIPPVAQLMESRKEMLQTFVKDSLAESEPPACPVRHEVLVGFPGDELAQASEDYNLIVMGTTGQSGVLEKIFGSVSSSVSQRAYCPVLLVPHDARFQPIQHIIYASNYESAGQEMVNKVAEFNQPFKAHIHFVHVKRNKDIPVGFDKVKEEIFRELFKEGEPPFAFDIAEVANDDVAEGISQYADEKNANLAIMVTRHRSIWQSLLHRSQTKRMALATHIPLMVLHLD